MRGTQRPSCSPIPPNPADPVPRSPVRPARWAASPDTSCHFLSSVDHAVTAPTAQGGRCLPMAHGLLDVRRIGPSRLLRIRQSLELPGTPDAVETVPREDVAARGDVVRCRAEFLATP